MKTKCNKIAQISNRNLQGKYLIVQQGQVLQQQYFHLKNVSLDVPFKEKTAPKIPSTTSELCEM